MGAVYAVAATFLGRALTRARQEEASEAEQRASEYEALIGSIRSSTTVGEISRQTSRATWEYRRRQLLRFLVAMSRGPQLLSVTHSVLIPGFFFLGAVALTAWAKLFTPVDQEGWEPSWWWVAALVAFLLGLWRLLSVLRAIEAIGGTSEESYFREQTAAFRAALDQRDRDSKPRLELTVRDEVQLTAGAEGLLPLRLRCVSGSTAHKVEVFLHLPVGFDFVNLTSAYTDDFGLRSAKVAAVDTLPRGLRREISVRIRAGDQPGEYDVKYLVACDEITLQGMHFSIVLAEPAPVQIASADDLPF